MARPSWDQYFMDIVDIVKQRSTCLRRTVGSVVVKDKQVLATGYNGAPMNCKHCVETGCLRQQLNVPSGERHEICRGVHAEQNAIAQAARFGVSLDGATIYTDTQPCVICAKMIINAGIIRVVYRGDYNDNMSLDMLRDAEVEVIKF